MVVFFHGHGANLAQDVRDRQQVPAQITAAGVNAVLVAPQLAVNAADSSAGKSGSRTVSGKRFLDESGASSFPCGANVWQPSRCIHVR